MCARYRLKLSLRHIADRLGLTVEEFEEFSERPRLNISISQRVPIVKLHEGRRKIDVAEWGFLAPWDKSKRIFNAAGETVAVKPTFRESFQNRRCLIPADGFYEWPNKQPTLIRFPDDRSFCFAGLWSQGAMTMITCAPQRLHAADPPPDAGDLAGRRLCRLARSTISGHRVAISGQPAPEAELVLIIEYSRTYLGRDRYQERKPTAIIRDAPDAVQRAMDQLAEPEEDNAAKNPIPEKKKRKIWNGIGKILQGGVLGVGNILLGAGSIVAPNPAIAAGVIASGAAAVGSICQGLGDLRGE